MGNCRPDHYAIERLVSSLGADVDQAHTLEDALKALQARSYRLVLVNRKLDHDYSDGVDVIRAIRASPRWSGVRLMLVSNYPEAQAEAVEAGAERGFGKLSLHTAATRSAIESAILPSD
ncbi:MAG: response regulator [Spirochaetia bacterium]|nr:response regulator [Spirochaetia bacterium]